MNTLDSLFAWFLAATLRGTLLAAAVIALGFVLRGRMPARWRYVLWLPVLLVLAAPRLPQSAWSAENWINAALFGRTPIVAVADAGSFHPTSVSAEVTPAEITPELPKGIAWRRVAAGVWLAGALLALLITFGSFARALRRIRRHSLPADPWVVEMLREATRTVGMRRAPELVVSSLVQSPAVYGFLQPVLLLPAAFPGALTGQEARLVLLHELMHLKKGDLPLNWLLCGLQALHWCNPLLWLAFARMRADREAACDAQVLEATPNDCRADYGHALLKLESTFAPAGLSLGFVGIFESTSGIGSRIRAIAAYRRSHPAWAVLGSVFLIALILAGATRAEGPQEGPPDIPAESRVDIQRKLISIVIPVVQFREMTIPAALDYLARQSIALDVTEPDPAKRGVRITVNLNAAGNPAPPTGTPLPATFRPQDARITVALKDIPLIEAIKYVTSLSNCKFRINAQGIEVVPIDTVDRLLTKEWTIPPDSEVVLTKNPKEALEGFGVTFPKGATTALSADGRRLVMKNSQENLDIVDALLDPSQGEQSLDATKGQLRSDEMATDQLKRKLNALIIPRLEFHNATLREAVDFLKRKSVELDVTEADVSRRGVNIVLKLESPLPGQLGAGAPPQDTQNIPGLDALAHVARAGAPPQNTQNIQDARLTLSLTNIPLVEALKYVTGLANVKFKVEPFAVAIVPLHTSTEVIRLKEWKLNDAIAAALEISGQDPKAALEKRGITFPPGTSAGWLSTPRRFLMKNTDENLDRFDTELGKVMENSPGR